MDHDPSTKPAANVLPENVTLVLGIPRSGTTMLGRVLGRHSQMDALMEPWHIRREKKFDATELEALAQECNVTLDPNRTLMIKETFQRADNLNYAFKTLERATERGVNCNVIVIFRSPIEAFLSQVEAANTLWKVKRFLGIDNASVVNHRNMIQRGFDVFFRHVFKYTHRVVWYDHFVANAEIETKRLLAPIGYVYEPRQLDFEAPAAKVVGGDPKTYQAGRTVSAESKQDRGDEVKKFIAEFKTQPNARPVLDLHAQFLDLMKSRKTDTEILTELFLKHGKPLSAPRDGAVNTEA